MLQCMTDPEDVEEYVDGPPKKIHVRRLLEWLDDTRANEKQRTVAEVCSSVPFICLLA